MKNEIVKTKHVKPIQKNSKNSIYNVINDPCVKIAVLEICSEKNNIESVVGPYYLVILLPCLIFLKNFLRRHFRENWPKNFGTLSRFWLWKGFGWIG